MQYDIEQRTAECDPSAWIAPNATVIGSVRLRAEASVWFNAVIRGDNEWIEIGERSNVQDGSVLHTDPGVPLVIGPDVTVGHLVMLHGCQIGERSLIGIGAVILNRVKIGRECIIGARTLIPEGKEIPDGSMVMGSPGKVVRELTAPERQMLKLSAQHYVQNARRYRERLAATPLAGTEARGPA